MSDDRPIRYVEQDSDGNETVVYRASGLGSCERIYVALANGRTGAPPPKFLQEIWQEGHDYETAIRGAYQARTECAVSDEQREVVLELGMMHGKNVIVRGHIDALVTENGGVYVTDWKKVRPSGWSNFTKQGIEWFKTYPWQLSVYYHALLIEGVDLAGWKLVGGKLEEGVINEIKEHQGLDAPLSLKAIHQFITRIENQIAQGYDAPEVPCDKSSYPCPFFALHDPDPEADTFEWPDDEEVGVLLEVFDSASKASRDAEKAAKAAKAKRDQASDAIYALIEHYGKDADAAKKLEGHGYKVTRVRTEGREVKYTTQGSDYLKITKEKGQ